MKAGAKRNRICHKLRENAKEGHYRFLLYNKDGNVCKVSYSQSEDTFYSICVIDEKVCEAMRASYEEASQEQENAVIKTIIK